MRAVGDLGANRAAAGAVPRRPWAVGHVRLSRRETLRHNPLNAVTASVERVHRADGSTVVRKELRRPAATDTGPWAGSDDPRHWNYWRREAEVYASAKVRAGLRDTGLDLPASCVKYAWLVPGMLARASATEHRAYHQVADAEHLYRQRGLVLAHLTGRCDEALALLEAGR